MPNNPTTPEEIAAWNAYADKIMSRGPEIWIEWGGKSYGPYADRAAARRDGFDVPSQSLPMAGRK